MLINIEVTLQTNPSQESSLAAASAPPYLLKASDFAGVNAADFSAAAGRKPALMNITQ